jgi:hypothetical protein
MQKFEIAIAVACLLVLGTMLAVTIHNGSLAVDIGRAEGFYVVPMDDYHPRDARAVTVPALAESLGRLN